jgi:hypothetical protein
MYHCIEYFVLIHMFNIFFQVGCDNFIPNNGDYEIVNQCA